MGGRRKHAARGFSLIELMTVVAILGILAATAFPRYTTVRNRALAAEVRIVLDVAQITQLSHFSTYGCFIGLRRSPENVATPNSQRHPFISVPTGVGDPCESRDFAFSDTDFRQEVPVYFLYECERYDNPANYTCNALGDLNEDGSIGEYITCSDYTNTGACQPSATGEVSLFPFEQARVSASPW